MMETDLIVIKQLPVIEDQLLAVKTDIEKRVAQALSLICTEDTYKDIKKVRSDLNKEYKELEARRIEVKKAVMAPYEKFEGVYKECAGDIYKRADMQLKAKIDEVEAGLRKQKADDLEKYFAEYRTSVGLTEDFVSLETADIRIGLSDSKQSLRKQAKEFLDRIASDLQVIKTLEHQDEVISEYRNNYNLSGAMLTVDRRHKAIEEERARREALMAKMEAEKAAAEAAAQAAQEAIQQEQAAAPEAIRPPVAMQDPEAQAPQARIYSTTFRVEGTLNQLKALKAFLEEGGYTYYVEQ